MKVIAALAAGLLIGTAGFAHAQTVNNPLFNQGVSGFTGWSVSGPPGILGNVVPPSGLMPPAAIPTVADVAGGFTGLMQVSQTISGMISGDIYQVGFWFAVASPAQSSSLFDVKFENTTKNFDATTASNFTYESFLVTANGSNGLVFQATNPGGVDFYFSGVSVTLVPEPATLAVLATGMIGLGLIRRRRA